MLYWYMNTIIHIIFYNWYIYLTNFTIIIIIIA
nr:MAG TPA: hypothetical protein [Bacteriophage sp.]